MTKTHKNVADSFIRISSCVSQMGTSEYMEIDRFLNKVICYPPPPACYLTVLDFREVPWSFVHKKYKPTGQNTDVKT